MSKIIRGGNLPGQPDRIEVTTTHQWVYRNTELYVLSGEAWAKDPETPALGPQITEQTLKSALALSWPETLQPVVR